MLIRNVLIDLKNLPVWPDNLNLGVYSSKFLSVSAQDALAKSPMFSQDGTKVYFHGSTNEAIFQYNLTVPFDVSTGTYSNKSLSVAAQETDSRGSCFSYNGTRLYTVGQTNNTIYQYNLTVPWDLTTGSYASKSLSVNAQETLPEYVEISPNGRKIYVLGPTSDTIFQYDLSVPFDVSTGSYSNRFLSVNAQETSPRGMQFSPDGLAVYIIGSSSRTIYKYDLNAPFDVSGGSYSGKSLSVVAQETATRGVCFKPDGTKCYICGITNNTIYQYNLP